MLRPLLMAAVSVAALLVAACDEPRTMTTQASLTPQVVYVPAPKPPEAREQLYGQSGSHRLVAGVNNSYWVAFVLDSGADLCLISLTLAKLLIDEGTMTAADMRGEMSARTASNQITHGYRVNPRSVT